MDNISTSITIWYFDLHVQKDVILFSLIERACQPDQFFSDSDASAFNHYSFIITYIQLSYYIVIHVTMKVICY